jgi:hypothetical protein
VTSELDARVDVLAGADAEMPGEFLSSPHAIGWGASGKASAAAVCARTGAPSEISSNAAQAKKRMGRLTPEVHAAL